MSKIYYSFAEGIAYVYSGFFVASFMVAGLITLFSMASVVAGLLGLFN